MKKTLFIILFVFIFQSLIVLFYSVSTEAHKVSAYVYREGDKVIGECYFVDGAPCKNSKVEVYDKEGRKIVETVTDEKGNFSFKTSNKDELKIVIPAGEGHRAEYTLAALEQVTAKNEIKKTGTQQSRQAQELKLPESLIKKDELRQIINEAMDSKLQGLQNEVRNIRKQLDTINYRDIIGGIGYIFGVWGLIMMLKGKKNAS